MWVPCATNSSVLCDRRFRRGNVRMRVSPILCRISLESDPMLCGVFRFCHRSGTSGLGRSKFSLLKFDCISFVFLELAITFLGGNGGGIGLTVASCCMSAHFLTMSPVGRNISTFGLSAIFVCHHPGRRVRRYPVI